MRWNCPHCTTALAITDEKLGAGWTFTRCYKCGGFGLVRRSEVAHIKIDAGPMAEKIVDPLSPRSELLSEKALQNLARPVTLPSLRVRAKTAAPPATLPPAASFPGTLPDSLVDSIAGLGEDSETATAGSSAQDSIEARAPRTVSPLAASILILVAISFGSGIYLYTQGRSLMRQINRPQTASNPVEAPATTDAAPEIAAIVDRVEQTASAPTTAAAAMPKGLKAQIQVTSAALRASPSVESALVAKSPKNARYEVVGWKDNWFEIKLPPSNTANAPETAWIRNDLVQLVTR